MPFHVVAQVSDIPVGQRKLVEVKGREVVIFNHEGEFFAVLNRCPHQGGRLCDGLLTVAITSDEPGHYEYVPERQVIRCPWHAWEFDIRTGKSWCEPDRVKVRTYKTEVLPGTKLVRGEYTAEIFPVKTENDYILIDA